MANCCSGCCQPGSALLAMLTELCFSWTSHTIFPGRLVPGDKTCCRLFLKTTSLFKQKL